LLVEPKTLFESVIDTGLGVLVRVGVAVGDPGVGVGGGGPQGDVKRLVNVNNDIKRHESK
jgi:hypothetical protein